MVAWFDAFGNGSAAIVTASMADRSPGQRSVAMSLEKVRYGLFHES